ncbi:VOC family protein [Sphingomonas yunnanensis]|uniref:VOC family protein n=1 Tax=Sphingomonas yunnanensis TaxID=310400 RepID=UPI001CA6ADC3|nr:VOC family protein [Sphingomonas yunnanensis]MBY9061858.1 VOC family protein [Sphingomonas yunnanensis]
MTPSIFADRAPDYVRFLEAAFGAREIGRSIAPDGRLADCQPHFDTTTIMVSEASDAYPATRAASYRHVADADAAMVRAEKAGAEPIMPVADMP